MINVGGMMSKVSGSKEFLIRINREGNREVVFQVTGHKSVDSIIEELEETIDFLKNTNLERSAERDEMLDIDGNLMVVGYSGLNKYSFNNKRVSNDEPENRYMTGFAKSDSVKRNVGSPVGNVVGGGITKHKGKFTGGAI